MSSRDAITIVRCGGMAEHWRKVVERCESGGGAAEVLKTDGGASVLALSGEKGSAGLVVKRWELRSLGARVKSGLKLSRAWRHWKGAERLSSAGVRTAACYAIARSVKEGVAVEWLIMDRLSGKTLLRHLADGDLSVQQEHALAREIGMMLDRLTAIKCYNRDGKPSNLIVAWEAEKQVAGRVGTAKGSGSGGPRVAVIDCVAIRRLPMIDDGGIYGTSLANLVLEPLGCKCPPRRTLMMRCLKSWYESWERRMGAPADWIEMRDGLWGEAAEVIAGHGDPTPRVNPLTTRPAEQADRAQ